MKRLFLLSIAWIALLGHSPELAAQAKKKSRTPVIAAIPRQPAPAEEILVPVLPEKGKEVIALYPFTTSAEYRYDFALSAGNAVEAGFIRSKRFTMVERSRFGIIREEEKFREANTSAVIEKAAKLGAKILVTGHILGVTTGVESNNVYPLSININRNIAQISLAFKIIEVESGAIKKSETILGKGSGSTSAEAIQKAYEEIDRLARSQVADYLPQRFIYASEVDVDKKNRLKKFKIWGGSDQGIKEGDLIEIYELSTITNPVTHKAIEEKRLRGSSKIVEVNSSESATCELQNANSIGEQLLRDLKEKPGAIVFEYKGTVRKR